MEVTAAAVPRPAAAMGESTTKMLEHMMEEVNQQRKQQEDRAAFIAKLERMRRERQQEQFIQTVISLGGKPPPAVAASASSTTQPAQQPISPTGAAAAAAAAASARRATLAPAGATVAQVLSPPTAAAVKPKSPSPDAVQPSPPPPPAAPSAAPPSEMTRGGGERSGATAAVRRRKTEDEKGMASSSTAVTSPPKMAAPATTTANGTTATALPQSALTSPLGSITAWMKDVPVGTASAITSPGPFGSASLLRSPLSVSGDGSAALALPLLPDGVAFAPPSSWSSPAPVPPPPAATALKSEREGQREKLPALSPEALREAKQCNFAFAQLQMIMTVVDQRRYLNRRGRAVLADLLCDVLGFDQPPTYGGRGDPVDSVALESMLAATAEMPADYVERLWYYRARVRDDVALLQQLVDVGMKSFRVPVVDHADLFANAVAGSSTQRRRRQLLLGQGTAAVAVSARQHIGNEGNDDESAWPGLTARSAAATVTVPPQRGALQPLSTKQLLRF